jgi:hypothetical protein
LKTVEKKISPALFVHIQKTAGTSIIDLARPRYGHSMTSHGDCWGYPPEYFDNTLFVSGHLGYDYAKHLMESRYSFTFLRDPIERVLSMYYFCRNQKSTKFDIYRAAAQFDLENFLQAGFEIPLIKKNIWNSQVWQLAHGYAHLDNRTISDFQPQKLLDLAITHLDAFSHIGFTETFEYDRNVILKALGLPIPEQEIISNVTLDRPKTKDLPEDVKNILYDLTELDRQLYAVAFSRRKSS